MSNKAEEKRKICFVISPIGSDGSDTRKRADKVLKYVIKPPVESLGYDVLRADNISDPGMITDQIIRHIVEDDLVVADLTGHNPNVFYELALRHALAKPFIQVIDANEKIPFDIAGFRTVHFDYTDLDSVDEAKQKIREQVEAIGRDDYKLVTPLSFSIDMKSFEASGDKEEIYLSKFFEVIKVMQGQITGLEKAFQRGILESAQYGMHERNYFEVTMNKMQREVSAYEDRLAAIMQENENLKSRLSQMDKVAARYMRPSSREDVQKR